MGHVVLDLVNSEELGSTDALQSALRSILEALVTGTDPDERALATLSSAASDAVAHGVPSFDDGHLGWTWDPADPRAVRWEVTLAAVDLLRNGRTDRIKACPTCGYFFLDTTKNGSRRWCSMDDCGKAEKMRRYVAKRAAQTHEGPPRKDGPSTR